MEYRDHGPIMGVTARHSSLHPGNKLRQQAFALGQILFFSPTFISVVPPQKVFSFD
jgi:hypothetical protein